MKIPQFICEIYNKTIKKNSLFNVPQKDVFIVLGAARTRTSLMTDILREAGIFVGHSQDLVKGDPNNPRGYLEHKKMIKLDRKLLRQSISRGKEELSEEFSLKTKNIFRKVQRFFTRIQMNRFLLKLYHQAKDVFVLKLNAVFFPAWQSHIPNFELILVYRHPVIMAHSNIKFKDYNYRFQLQLLRWERLYREFIYYYGRYSSIVVNSDDLFNPEKQDKVLRALVDFIGRGKVNDLKNIIKPEFDRSSKEVNRLIEVYPLPQSTKDVWEVLEKIKI